MQDQIAEDTYRALGAAVRSRRRDVGMSQARLAEKVGLSRPSITNIEGGKQPILAHQMVLFARALSVPVIELFAVLDVAVVDAKAKRLLPKGTEKGLVDWAQELLDSPVAKK